MSSKEWTFLYRYGKDHCFDLSCFQGLLSYLEATANQLIHKGEATKEDLCFSLQVKIPLRPFLTISIGDGIRNVGRNYGTCDVSLQYK